MATQLARGVEHRADRVFLVEAASRSRSWDPGTEPCCRRRGRAWRTRSPSFRSATRSARRCATTTAAIPIVARPASTAGGSHARRADEPVAVRARPRRARPPACSWTRGRLADVRKLRAPPARAGSYRTIDRVGEQLDRVIDELGHRGLGAGSELVQLAHRLLQEDGEHRATQIVDVEEVAGLATVAVDHERFAIHDPLHEVRDDAALVVAERPVHVREPQSGGREPVRTGERRAVPHPRASTP